MPERLHTAEGHRQGQNWSASENPFRVNSRPAKRKRGAGASALLLFQDHLLLPRVREAEGGQQQLRLGSEGCLRSLKPLLPEGWLVSPEGILRLISIKSSFMFIAFFALVSTKIA